MLDRAGRCNKINKMKFTNRSTAILIFILCSITTSAQKTIINYVLIIDTSDLSGYDVEMHIQNAPKIFHLAMATHHEYDDRYWRFIENFNTQSSQQINFVREDSALWKITYSGKDAAIKYRIHLPGSNISQRPAWLPFLSSTGGLVGSMHSFMYLVEQPNISCNVTFQLPQGWQIATGLQSTNNDKTFYTANAKELLDCPAMVGKFQSWNFLVRGVPHKIVYWWLPNATMFDTSLLVNNIKKIVPQVVKLFDTIPYKNYVFLLQDGAYAALEHSNSVTIGLPGATFERDIQEMNSEIAHEFFHAWNLMRLRPAEYSELNYGPKEKASGLWWSEGLSIFYTDVLLRRAKFPVEDSTRIIHLEKLIESYFSNSGNAKISPEKASLESNAAPGGLGNYSVSVHFQGEVLGAIIDLIIRDATNGKRTIDDVMRKMFRRFSRVKGFYGKDIEQTVKEICGCDVHSFFQSYVYNANTMDFSRYLKLIGQQVNVTWKPAVDDNGKPMADYHMYIDRLVGDSNFIIVITDPQSCWGKADLHTGDKIISINNMPVTNSRAFRNIQRTMQVGDKVSITVSRKSVIKKIDIIVTGFYVPVAHITSIKNITTKQEQIFSAWSLD